MLGTYVNVAAIIVGSILGLLIKNGLKEKYKTIIMHAVGLSVLFIGISTTLGGILNGGEPILFILSLVIGGVFGEWIDIDKKLHNVGEFLQSKVGKGTEHNLAKGFVTASLLFCVGTMAILGSLESGLQGKHDMLYAKSVLDGITSIILTSTIGIGVAFSAVAVLIYQGSITLFAKFMEPFLTTEIIREISIIGGVLIFSLGLGLLDLKKIKTANLLPAILIPPVYYLLFKPLVNYIGF